MKARPGMMPMRKASGLLFVLDPARPAMMLRIPPTGSEMIRPTIKRPALNAVGGAGGPGGAGGGGGAMGSVVVIQVTSQFGERVAASGERASGNPN